MKRLLIVAYLTPFFLLLLSSQPTFVSPCDDKDKATLLAFASNLTTTPFRPLNWSNDTDCCAAWEGITCDATRNRVAKLSLPSRGLAGVIPPAFAAGLTSLAELDLSRNSLSDSLPAELFTSLPELKLLNLSFNRLRGELPAAVAARTTTAKLRVVDLSSNFFAGAVPVYLFGPSLVAFNASNNSFSGRIPSFCGASINLTDLTLNDFAGEIPAGFFSSCAALKVFRAGFNNLSGPIPGDLYGVETLEEISLPANKLTGEIESGLVKLSRLKTLELYSNLLVGPIPVEIGRLSALKCLLLHINYLIGPIPPSITNLTNLLALNLRVNLLSGNISGLDFSPLTQLTLLDIGNNFFTGTIPASLYSCVSLTAVRMAGNKLGGAVSPEISALKSLSFLSISNNSFTNISVAFHSLKSIKSLTTLVMSKNFYYEDIPEDESIVVPDGFQNLKVLAFGGCYLTGTVPSWLSKLNKLQVLDLSVNNLTGSIPAWLGGFTDIYYLDLSGNLLTGEFPIQFCSLKALTSGFGNLTRPYLALPVFVMPNNATNQQYNQLSYIPPALYLSNNKLTGTIPAEIGQLRYLHVLELNNNSLNGTIPDQISNLVNLERLDLSRNNLTGQIPPSLKNLHFLSFFSVAYNDLRGPVPLGGQFNTFGGSSYDGNPGLCGPPAVQRSCSTPSSPSHSHRKSHSNRKLLVGVVVGACFGVGFVVTVALALWILSSRRILPRGDSDQIEFDDTTSSDGSSVTADAEKDASLVVLFSNNTNNIKDLSLVEILMATENFNQANIIGCGGFGLVYKATLGNGTKLAIKKLSGDLGLMEREFKAEVEALSTAQHENLVSLQGYCVHDGCRLLIYSYMENGSLDFWLHENPDGPSELDWPTRLKILRGASLGLAYMHRVCEPHIVHRDIKSSNILLDENFKAHVADFGLSRLILPYQTHVSTELVGTLGYIPPEYGQAWVATLRGDMYSFGVVMLEMLTGKRPVEVFKPRVSRELVGWVLQMRNEGRHDEVFDGLLRGKGFEEEMVRVLDVACMCVNQNPFKRPDIQDVVDWLRNCDQ